MKKVTDFIEAHIEWLAVAVGVLYLGLMAWTYVIGSPTSVSIDGQDLGPGQVDPYIADKVVTPLEAKVKTASVPKFGEVDWVKSFRDQMALADLKPAQMEGLWVNAPPVMRTIGGRGPKIEDPSVPKVTQLPVLPPAVMGEFSMGASSVVPGAGALAGADGAGGGAAPPNNRNRAPAVAVAAVPAVDKNWVTVGFKIPSTELAKAFGEVKLPKVFYKTAVLQVQLYRQEQTPDGKWTAEVPIKRLPIQQIPPMPGDKAQPQQYKDFLSWAVSHQPEIIQPPFYQIAKGDPWNKPTAVVEPPPVEAPPETPVVEGLPDFDPNKDYGPDDIKKMTPKQKKEYFEAKQKRDRDKNRGRGGGGRPGGKGGKGGGAAGGGGGGMRAIDDSDALDDYHYDGLDVPNPYALEPDAPPYRGILSIGGPLVVFQDPPQDERGNPPASGAPPPETPADPNNPNPTTQPAEGFCPNGEFDAGNIPDITGWAHDETVEPGKIYRYKVVYSIKSPVYAAPNACKPQDLAKTFALGSDAAKTEWSKEVKIPARTSFYIARQFNESANPVVKFEVFAWQGGAKKSRQFDIAPGDMVGHPVDGVDYSTGWTLVDVARDPRNGFGYALVCDPTGAVYKRDFNTDQANPDFAADRAAAAAAPQAGAGGG
jgi:hypothetical protein